MLRTVVWLPIELWLGFAPRSSTAKRACASVSSATWTRVRNSHWRSSDYRQESGGAYSENANRLGAIAAKAGQKSVRAGAFDFPQAGGGAAHLFSSFPHFHRQTADDYWE